MEYSHKFVASVCGECWAQRPVQPELHNEEYNDKTEVFPPVQIEYPNNYHIVEHDTCSRCGHTFGLGDTVATVVYYYN